MGWPSLCYTHDSAVEGPLPKGQGPLRVDSRPPNQPSRIDPTHASTATSAEKSMGSIQIRPIEKANPRVGFLFPGGGLQQRRRARSHHQAVPGVDLDDAQGQVGDFLGAEMGLHLFVGGVRHLLAVQGGDGLGPGQGGALAGIEYRRFLPGGGQVDLVLAEAVLARQGHVHGDAEGAAVDLGDAQAHQFEQAQVQAGALDVGVHAEHGLVAVGNQFADIEALFHGFHPLGG